MQKGRRAAHCIQPIPCIPLKATISSHMIKQQKNWDIPPGIWNRLSSTQYGGTGRLPFCFRGGHESSPWRADRQSIVITNSVNAPVSLHWSPDGCHGSWRNVKTAIDPCATCKHGTYDHQSSLSSKSLLLPGLNRQHQIDLSGKTVLLPPVMGRIHPV